MKANETGKIIRLNDYQTKTATETNQIGIGVKFPLRIARKAVNMSEAAAAAALQITQATLHDWESGKTSPSMSKAIKMSVVYGFPLDDLDFSKAANQKVSV